MKLNKIFAIVMAAAVILGFAGCKNDLTLAEKLVSAGSSTPKAKYDMKIEVEFSEPYSSKSEYIFYACYSNNDTNARSASFPMNVYSDPECTTSCGWSLSHLDNYYYELIDTSNNKYIRFYTNGYTGGYHYGLPGITKFIVNGTECRVESDQ